MLQLIGLYTHHFEEAEAMRRWLLVTVISFFASGLAFSKDVLPTHRTDVAPQGILDVDLVRISIAEQALLVTSKGKVVATSEVTSGKWQTPTPTGAFFVLEKHKHYVSSLYAGVAMPNTLMITKGGVAIHGGSLASRPVSGGCVRLPVEFSEWLFKVIPVGTIIEIRPRWNAKIRAQYFEHRGKLECATCQ